MRLTLTITSWSCSTALQATARRRLPIRKNVSLLALPRYSPELNPVERWFQEFRRALSNRIFETIELLQEALTQTLEPYSGKSLPAYNNSPVSLGG